MKEKIKIICWRLFTLLQWVILIIVPIFVLYLLRVIFGEEIISVLIVLGGMVLYVYSHNDGVKQGKKEMENLYWHHLDSHQTSQTTALGCPFCRIDREQKLDLLSDALLEGTIIEEEYAAKKQKILNQKIDKEDKKDSELS